MSTLLDFFFPFYFMENDHMGIMSCEPKHVYTVYGKLFLSNTYVSFSVQDFFKKRFKNIT